MHTHIHLHRCLSIHTYISPSNCIHVDRLCLALLLHVGATDLKQAVNRPLVVLPPELQPLAVSAWGRAYDKHMVVHFIFLQLRQVYRAAA